MTRAHLLDTDDPVREGFDLLANCGEVVPKAQFEFLWNNERYPEFLAVSMSRICPKCRTSELARRYVYGIVAAPEAEAEQLESQEVLSAA